MEQVVIATEVSEPESREVWRLWNRGDRGLRSRVGRLFVVGVCLISLVPGTIAAVFWSGGTDASTVHVILRVSLPWIGGLIVCGVVYWLIYRRGVAVWYQAGDVPRSLIVVATPKGVEVEWDGFKCFQSWHQFDVVHDTDSVILCMNSRLPVAITKNLQSKDELAAIDEWLSAAIPKRIQRFRK
ncbi:MAG: hypothetical protein GC159_09810 [Phycisphaera sp.]|nr:hypothetical protein [Phycisphaera sp.]